MLFRSHVEAGKGGHGVASVHREKFKPLAGPDGGNGGNGGDITLVVDSQTTTLLDYHHAPHRSAENGQPGMGDHRAGKHGESLVIPVPDGTVVKDEQGNIVADLVGEGATYVAAAGGPDSLVGHRGVRLSGGQVQRLALARALATEAELLLADDVSSALDATTEIELWQSLRRRGVTVVGATSKRAALAQADRVVVLVDVVVGGAGRRRGAIGGGVPSARADPGGAVAGTRAAGEVVVLSHGEEG